MSSRGGEGEILRETSCFSCLCGEKECPSSGAPLKSTSDQAHQTHQINQPPPPGKTPAADCGHAGGVEGDGVKDRQLRITHDELRIIIAYQCMRRILVI
jgi:hypothetical protein